MKYFARSNRLDTFLVAFLSLGTAFLILASAYGQIALRVDSPTDAGCGIENLREQIEALPENKSRLLAIIGDGVPGEFLVPDRPYNTQFAQGFDLHQGVSHALEEPIFHSILQSLAILSIDDGGNPVCARQIADFLAREPRLIGVVGHSTTSTTQEALPSYIHSNIPVVIPAATHPDLLEAGASNLFRLPSNDTIQSLVIADIVLTQFEAQNVFIVWDATPEASQYSEYLKTTIQHFLTDERFWGSLRDRPPVVEGSYPISLNPLNYSYLFKRIVSSEPDVVIFSGYGSLAREFLLGLDSEYSLYENLKRPKIMLTDGCKIPGIKGYGFETYLTFAAAPLSSFPAFEDYDGGPRISLYETMWTHESFEIFGYDAMVLLLTAIRGLAQSEDGVSRRQIIQWIREQRQRGRTAYSYTFDESGENFDHRYYCYSLTQELRLSSTWCG